MDGIIQLSDVRRVHWLVRRWRKFVLVVTVDLRASQIFEAKILYLGLSGLHRLSFEIGRW